MKGQFDDVDSDDLVKGIDIDAYELSESEEEDLIFGKISIFAPDVLILKDKNSLKYLASDNRTLTPKALIAVLDKGGRYIVNLGLVNYFEALILNMFLVVYSY